MARPTYKKVGLSVELPVVKRSTDGKLYLNHPDSKVIMVEGEPYQVIPSRFGGYFLAPVKTPETKA